MFFFYLQVPAVVRFFGKGGMTAQFYAANLLSDLIHFKPHFVFLTKGGNDIKHNSEPKEIARFIEELLSKMLDDGAKKCFSQKFVREEIL